jgi:hypothetical protein
MKANNKVVTPAKGEARNTRKKRKIPIYFWPWLLLILIFLLAAYVVGSELIGQRADFVPEAYPKILDDNVYVVQEIPGKPHLENLEVREVEGGILVTWRWVIAPEPGTYSMVSRTWDQRVNGREEPVRSVTAMTSPTLIPFTPEDRVRVTHANIEAHYSNGGMINGGHLPLNSRKY